MKLLSTGTNAKTSKSDGLGEYLTAILYMAPAAEHGSLVYPKKTLCSHASPGCLESCLYTAGRGGMSSVQQARMAKARYLLEDPRGFLEQLEKELTAFQKKCLKAGKKPAVRLNGTSDVLWERKSVGYSGLLIPKFPEIQLYDYTKIPSRMAPSHVPRNYHLTFSRSENTSQFFIEELCRKGSNVAVVFNEIPKTYLGIPVINGDTHDLRFLDPSGVIVGLAAKGQARKDTSGFVVVV